MTPVSRGQLAFLRFGDFWLCFVVETMDFRVKLISRLHATRGLCLLFSVSKTQVFKNQIFILVGSRDLIFFNEYYSFTFICLTNILMLFIN